MKLRVVERPWETVDRRRYAVEQLRYVIDGEEFWGVERFFERVLDAQLFMASLAKGPRVVSEREIPDPPTCA